MEASKRERVVLLGVVPILAASFGAVATVLGQKYFGSPSPAPDAVLAVLRMQGVSPADKVKLIQAVTADSERFYSFLHIAIGALGAPLGYILVRFGNR